MAVTAFPSWAYNSAGQSSLIVASQAAFDALTSPGTWAFTPYATITPTPPAFDPGFEITDTRLQQSLIEQRVTNVLLQQGLNIQPDVDLTGLRQEIKTLDSGPAT